MRAFFMKKTKSNTADFPHAQKGKTTTTTTTRKREEYVFTKSIHATGNLERRTKTFRGVSSRAFVSVFFFFSKFFGRRKRRREIIVFASPMG